MRDFLGTSRKGGASNARAAAAFQDGLFAGVFDAGWPSSILRITSQKSW
jgi:hypothetical protein